MDIGQTVYKTSIQCPECNNERVGLCSDGRHYWCVKCKFGIDKDIEITDLPDIPKPVVDHEDNSGI